jgi:hypothetical protein
MIRENVLVCFFLYYNQAFSKTENHKKRIRIVASERFNKSREI